MSLAAGTRLGPYEILSAIGAGGMGEVYRARDSRLERDVALKVLPADTLSDETARARLVREARLASKLNHPHVCTIYEVGEADGQVYIAMELIEGRPLSTRLTEGPLPIERVLGCGQQLADALAHAHSRGVIHRDLKSANVVVTPDGQVKVLDFGLARRLTGEEFAEATTVSQPSLTAPGAVAGTLAYMAPEQLRGQPADARSDIWALGVVLYEMAAGRRPFQGRTGFELTSAILNQAWPPLPSAVPLPLQAVVGRCLAKAPGERYQRGTEAQAALEAVQAGTIGARWRGARALVRRRWLLGAAAGLALLVLAVALLAALDVGDQTQVWTETYERQEAGILRLESEVAEKVAGALALTLLPAEKTRLTSARAVNPEAYDAYLKGLRHWYNLTPRDLDAALKYFELALEKDPNYAPAYAGISLVWCGRQQVGWASRSEAAPKAKAAVLKALALDDTAPVAHYAQEIIMTWSDWDWAGAESEFKRTLELNPSYPDARAYYSHLLIIMGRPEEAMAQGERALELDPLNPLIRSLYANGFLFSARRYDDAIAQARKALRTSPDHLAAQYALWYAYARKGMYTEAFSSARPFLIASYGGLAANALDRGYAEGGYRAAMKRTADALAANSREAYAIASDIGGLYIQAGDADRALEWLEKGFESHDPGMPYLGLYYDGLRADPRYQALLRRMGLPATSGR